MQLLSQARIAASIMGPGVDLLPPLAARLPCATSDSQLLSSQEDNRAAVPRNSWKGQQTRVLRELWKGQRTRGQAEQSLTRSIEGEHGGL